MKPLVAIRLHGPLAESFGAEHRFRVRSPKEACAALVANHPSFRNEAMKFERLAFMVDGEWFHGDDALHVPLGRELDICPVIEGRAFIGAAFIGFLIPSLAGTAVANIIGGLLITGLLLGVSMFLSPKAKTKPTKDSPKDDSYMFSGPDNVVTQGTAVPVAYGRVWCGSVVISAGLETQDIPIGSSTRLAESQASPAMISRRVPGVAVELEAPAGYIFAGEQAILDAKTVRVVPLWFAPDGSLTWDLVRGFKPGLGDRS